MQFRVYARDLPAGDSQHWASGFMDILIYHNVPDTDLPHLDTPITNNVFQEWLNGIFRHQAGPILTEVPLTRLDGAIMAARAFHMPDASVDVLSQFLDYYLVPAIYRPAMAGMVAAGIIRGHGSGQGAGLLAPLSGMTYGQAAALIVLTMGEVFYKSGVYYDITVPGNAVINSGGVNLVDVSIYGNLIITGHGEDIYLTGHFAHIVVDTTSPIVINGVVERLTILADDADVSISDTRLSKRGPPFVGITEPSPTPTAEPARTPRPIETSTPGPVITPAPVLPTPSPVPTPSPMPELTPTPAPEPTPSPSPEPTPSPSPEPTPSPSPEPTPSPTPEPTPSPSPEPTPSPTPEPTPSPTPEPTPSPTPEPTPSPEPTPTPPIKIGTPTLAADGSLNIQHPDGGYIVIPPSTQLFNLIDSLNPMDELILDNNEITGIILSDTPYTTTPGLIYIFDKLNPGDKILIDNGNITGVKLISDHNPTTLTGPGLNSLLDMEIHLGPNAEVQLDGLLGQLGNVLIVGTEGSSLEILPTASWIGATISITGDMSLDIAAASSMALLNFLHLNVVGEAELYFSSLSALATFIDLSEACSAVITTFNGVTIHVDESLPYVVALNMSGSQIRMELSDFPAAPPLDVKLINPNQTVWLEPNRILYLDENGILHYRYL